MPEAKLAVLHTEKRCSNELKGQTRWHKWLPRGPKQTPRNIRECCFLSSQKMTHATRVTKARCLACFRDPLPWPETGSRKPGSKIPSFLPKTPSLFLVPTFAAVISMAKIRESPRPCARHRVKEGRKEGRREGMATDLDGGDPEAAGLEHGADAAGRHALAEPTHHPSGHHNVLHGRSSRAYTFILARLGKEQERILALFLGLVVAGG